MASPQQTTPTTPTSGALTQEQRRLTVERVSDIVGRNYLFPELAAELAGFVKTRWERGAYSKIESMPGLVDLLNRDLASICGDRHLTVVLGREVAVTRERMRLRRQRLEETNYGFNRVDRLPGNIGYLELTEFCPLETAATAMRESFAALEGSDVLIIDLRANEGGSGDLVPRICGLFFDAPTHLYDIVNPRNGETVKTMTPKDTPVERMTDIPIYILTSKTTYSAAECLAYSLQTLRRATVVGERTAGGAHPTRSFVIRELEIVVTVPVRDMRNPVTGTNWEGTGVMPDLEVPADLALEAALDHALASRRADQPSEPALPPSSFSHAAKARSK